MVKALLDSGADPLIQVLFHNILFHKVVIRLARKYRTVMVPQLLTKPQEKGKRKF